MIRRGDCLSEGHLADTLIQDDHVGVMIDTSNDERRALDRHLRRLLRQLRRTDGLRDARGVQGVL